MEKPVRYSPAVRERAVRLVTECRKDPSTSAVQLPKLLDQVSDRIRVKHFIRPETQDAQGFGN